jgi:hypothetical protein
MTNATTYTNVTINMPDSAAAVLPFTLLETIMINGAEIFAGTVYSATLDGAGLGDIDLPSYSDVTAAALYQVVLPDGRDAFFTLPYSVTSLALSTLLAAQVSQSSPSVLNNYVLKAGDTMTGLLILSDDPADDLGAATKQYVDANTGASAPGTLTVSTTNTDNGTTHTHAITASSAPGVASSILATDSNGAFALTISNTTGDGATFERSYSSATETGSNTYLSGVNIANNSGILAFSPFIRLSATTGVNTLFGFIRFNNNLRLLDIYTSKSGGATPGVSFSNYETARGVVVLGSFTSTVASDKAYVALNNTYSLANYAIYSLAPVPSLLYGDLEIGNGGDLILSATSSTTARRAQGKILGAWNVSTDATREGDLILYATDYGGDREGLRVRGNGTAPAIGFYGVAPVARQVLATGTGASVDNVITALQNLGLLAQS